MERREVRVTSINASTLALVEGGLGLLLGLMVSILAWISTSGNFNINTQIVLQGLILGMAPGFGAVIATAIVYYVAGWILGIVHGALFNLVATWSRGLDIATEPNALEATEPEVEPAAVSARRGEPAFGETIGRRRQR